MYIGIVFYSVDRRFRYILNDTLLLTIMNCTILLFKIEQTSCKKGFSGNINGKVNQCEMPNIENVLAKGSQDHACEI